MSFSTNLASYPIELQEMVETVAIEGIPKQLAFASDKEAKAFRLYWYAFRKCLTRENHPIAGYANAITVTLGTDHALNFWPPGQDPRAQKIRSALDQQQVS